MNEKLNELRARWLEVSDLNAAAAVLNWDQTTYMPPGGAPARARQRALLAKLAQERQTDPAIGRLLDELRAYEASMPYDSDEASLIRVARRKYEQATRVPVEFTARSYAHAAQTYQAWTVARPKNDFASLRPMLEKSVDLSREFSSFFSGYQHIADPLIDMHDEGMTVATLRPLFAELRQALVPMVTTIQRAPSPDSSCLHRHYPAKDQIAFGEEIIRRFGYDFSRGRQDLTHHPYTTKFSIGDVRITTRTDENDLTHSLFPTFHEAGHALYEQYISATYEGTPLDGGASAGTHESQSRLWENLVGRSRPFWSYYYPRLQAAFRSALDGVSLDTFYRAVNKVEPSLIRTKADEVTYNLRVMIRFDLELALLEGRLAVKDVAEAWHARYQQDLGIHAPDDRDGVMQDVHWYMTLVGGAFQGYTLGNIMSAAFYDAALRAHPEIPGQIGRGEFGTLHAWLVENIYRHGSKYTADELLRRVTGGPLSIGPYVRYLRGKYGEVYGI